jgi:hypothetical protein
VTNVAQSSVEHLQQVVTGSLNCEKATATIFNASSRYSFVRTQALNCFFSSYLSSSLQLIFSI